MEREQPVCDGRRWGNCRGVRGSGASTGIRGCEGGTVIVELYIGCGECTGG